MFQNVLMTAVTPLRDTNEIHCWDNRPFTTIWPEFKYQGKTKDVGVKKTIKKKNKRYRTVFTTEQVRELEKVFARSKYIDIERRQEIAGYLKIDQKCIKIWFQNRRMKEKKELSESCDSASEGTRMSQSVSPPLDTTLPSNHTQDNINLHSHEDLHHMISSQSYQHEPTAFHGIRAPQYYYNIPNDYFNTERQLINYESSNIMKKPEYDDFINVGSNEFKNKYTHPCNGDYSTNSYTSETENKNYYNMGYTNDQYEGNTQNWAVNYLETSYI